MKTKVEVILAAFLSMAAAMVLNAQGYIAFNNLDPNSGLVYLLNGIPGGVLLDQDVNFQLLGGADPFSLQPIHTWLLSDGSATSINVAPGRFADPTHGVYAVPGVEPGGTAYLQVLGWTGNFDTWEAAVRFGVAGGTGGFPNPTSVAASAPGLTGMISFIIGIPEPATLALLGLGGCAFVVPLFRRQRPR